MESRLVTWTTPDTPGSHGKNDFQRHHYVNNI